MATKRCSHASIEVCNICHPSEVNTVSEMGLKTKVPHSPMSDDDFKSIASFKSNSSDASSTSLISVDENIANWLQPPYLIKPDQSYRFNNIVGHNDVKKVIKETIINPLSCLDVNLQRGGGPRTGLILYGTPGTGKTFMAKSIMNEIIHEGVNLTCLQVSSSDLISKWMGESEKQGRSLIDALKLEAPSVVLIDEIDYLFGARSDDKCEGMDSFKTELLTHFQSKTNLINLIYALNGFN